MNTTDICSCGESPSEMEVIQDTVTRVRRPIAGTFAALGSALLAIVSIELAGGDPPQSTALLLFLFVIPGIRFSYKSFIGKQLRVQVLKCILCGDRVERVV